MENSYEPGDNSLNFWKNSVLVIVFFAIAPVALAASLFSLISISKPKANTNAVYADSRHSIPSGVKVFASLPVMYPSVSQEIVAADARVEMVRQYLSLNNSPLTPYADLIILNADKYGVDYRLIAAIAQKESGLCRVIPPESYNCWGWGIHSKGTLGFSSFEEGIETVTKGISEEYIAKGFTTLEEIMSKYTPLSNGSWASDVSRYMSEME